MAAGLGFKTFTTGEVLTAADTNGYLMQGVLVFADATARDAAITSPQEGQFAYLKDTNVTTYYTGSAWANLDTTGMTNPMTTTGDVIYSSSGSTPARLGIGTAGQVLAVNSGATAPEWVTPAAGGGKILQAVYGTTTTVTSVASTTFTDTTLTATITPTSASSTILIFVNQSCYSARSTADVGGEVRIVRGATTIYTPGNDSGFRNMYVNATGATATNIGAIYSIIYRDSPATTSATTYKTQGRTYLTTNSGATSFQGGDSTSSILLLEVGA